MLGSLSHCIDVGKVDCALLLGTFTLLPLLVCIMMIGMTGE